MNPLSSISSIDFFTQRSSPGDRGLFFKYGGCFFWQKFDLVVPGSVRRQGFGIFGQEVFQVAVKLFGESFLDVFGGQRSLSLEELFHIGFGDFSP